MKLLLSTFEHGGVIMYPLFALSAVIWALVGCRYLVLRRQPLNGFALAEDAVGCFQKGSALEFVERIRGVRGVLPQVLRRLFTSQQAPTETEIEAEFLGAESQMQGRHQYLAVLIQVAPLLGLLGTVVGMMQTFAVLALLGTGEPRALSGGISQALLTTQAGLCVAIPGIFGQAWIKRWEGRLQADLDRARLTLSQIAVRDSEETAARAGR